MHDQWTVVLLEMGSHLRVSFLGLDRERPHRSSEVHSYVSVGQFDTMTASRGADGRSACYPFRRVLEVSMRTLIDASQGLPMTNAIPRICLFTFCGLAAFPPEAAP